MRGALIRLVVFSVLAGWAVVLLASIGYGRSQTWTEDNAQRHGVLLAHAMLEQTPTSDRAERLPSLQAHVGVELSLVSMEELERRIGRPGAPGEGIPDRTSIREAWYYTVFEDGSGALMAGPVDPVVPTGVVPVGLLLAIVLVPVITGTVALHLGRGILTVERANKALTVGDLSVRVDNGSGPSNELATSFNAMAERVEALIRSRDELVQAVSHELGSPLSRLRFQVELLEDLSEADRRKRIQMMALELDALDALVAELLSYIQSDELELNRQTFAPQEHLTHLAELARHEIPNHRSVSVDLQLSPGISVFADQRLFLRTIENLLRNAVQHAHGEVLLELSQEEEQIRVVVHDDGPGIPEALRENVRAPFFRLQAERDRETGGVGLGLAIASRIMDRHDGHLVIETSPLGGAKAATLWPRLIP